MTDLILSFLSDELLTKAGSGLGGLLFAAFSYLKIRKAVADRIVDVGIPIAYAIVEQLARKSTNKIDDKALVALKALEDYCQTRGLDSLSADQVNRAQLVFKALASGAVVPVLEVK